MKIKPKELKRTTGQRKVLIVDDHPLIRAGLQALINAEPDLAVCGETDNSAEALALLSSLEPDLVIVDLTLREHNGLELVKKLYSLNPRRPTLVVSIHDEAIYAQRVLQLGARGYIMKQESNQELLRAIRRVLEGLVYVSPHMSMRIVEMVSQKTAQKSSSPIERLTHREFEVFRLIGSGKGTPEIAKDLSLSVKTVDVHRANIRAKLEIRSTAQLVHFAVRWMEPR